MQVTDREQIKGGAGGSDKLRVRAWVIVDWLLNLLRVFLWSRLNPAMISLLNFHNIYVYYSSLLVQLGTHRPSMSNAIRIYGTFSWSLTGISHFWSWDPIKREFQSGGKLQCTGNKRRTILKGQQEFYLIKTFEEWQSISQVFSHLGDSSTSL